MLLPYLRQQLAKGQTHLAVTPAAREVLRKIYKGEIAFGEKAAAKAATQTKTATAPAHPKEQKHMIPRPTALSDRKAPLNIPTPCPQGDTAEEQLASLRNLIENCSFTRDLGSFRKTLVFSIGSPEADLMLIGDTPGYHEEQKREPFAGPAGDKLTAILAAMGLAREQIYITNLCKFRPALPGQTRNNRPARPEEIQISRPYLRAEIEIVRPKVIIALGAAAAHGLLDSKDSFDDLRNVWHEIDGIPVRVSHHPSFLLLADKDALTEKRKIWEDMLVVMEKLNLPISEKQRAFFLPKS